MLVGPGLADGCFGDRRGVRFVELATLGKRIPLIVLVRVAIAIVEPTSLRWAVAPTAGSVGAASLLLFFAFFGFETALSNGGEMKDPRRTVPRGLLARHHINHLIHHRGQLSVYLRLLDVPIPELFGPTADTRR